MYRGFVPAISEWGMTEWPTLTKFMAIPNCAYLVLKMPGTHGVISNRGHVKWAYDCDNESCEMANILTASAEL
jgi:hypothetical protein